MNTRLTVYLIAFLVIAAGISGLLTSIVTADTLAPSPKPATWRAYEPTNLQTPPDLLADSPISPTSPVKLIFIHHSTGGNWLADIGAHDQAGGLGPHAH